MPRSDTPPRFASRSTARLSDSSRRQPGPSLRMLRAFLQKDSNPHRLSARLGLLEIRCPSHQLERVSLFHAAVASVDLCVCRACPRAADLRRTLSGILAAFYVATAGRVTYRGNPVAGYLFPFCLLPSFNWLSAFLALGSSLSRRWLSPWLLTSRVYSRSSSLYYYSQCGMSRIVRATAPWPSLYIRSRELAHESLDLCRDLSSRRVPSLDREAQSHG